MKKKFILLILLPLMVACNSNIAPDTPITPDDPDNPTETKTNPIVKIYVDDKLKENNTDVGSFSLNNMPTFSFTTEEDVIANYRFESESVNYNEKVPASVGNYRYVVTTTETDKYNALEAYVSFSLYDDSFYLTLLNTKDMANLIIEDDKPIFVINANYIGEYREQNKFSLVDGTTSLSSKDVVVNKENKTIQFKFCIEDLKEGLFYSHLYINTLPFDDIAGDVKNNVYSYSKLESENNIQVGNLRYTIVEQYNMANIHVQNVESEEDTCKLSLSKIVDLKLIEDRPYYVVNGTFTGKLLSEDLKVDLKPSISFKEFDILDIGDHKWTGYLDISDISENKLHYPHILYKDQTLSTSKNGDILELCISNGETIVSNGYRYTIYEDGYKAMTPLWGMATLYKASVTTNAITFTNSSYGLEIIDGQPYFTIKGLYFGELELGDLSLFDGSIVAVFEKLEKDEDTNEFIAFFNISNIQKDFYSHLNYKNNSWGNCVGMTSNDIFINNGYQNEITPVTLNNKTYQIIRGYAMPVIRVVEAN